MPKRNFTLVGAHAGKTITLGNHNFVDGVLAFEGSDSDVLIVTRALRDQYQAFGPDELEEAQAAYEEARAEAALNEPRETAASREMDLKQKLVARRLIAENIDPETLYGPGPMAEQVKANMAILLIEEAEGTELVATAEEIAAQKAAAEAADKAEADRLAKEAADKAEADRLAKETADKEAADKAEADRLAKEAADKAEQDRLDKEAADKAAADAAEAERLQQQSQENGGGEQPPVDAKIETVADALKALDPANDEHWTARGVPSMSIIEQLMGRDVSRAEVEAVAPDLTRAVAKAQKAAAAS